MFQGLSDCKRQKKRGSYFKSGLQRPTPLFGPVATFQEANYVNHSYPNCFSAQTNVECYQLFPPEPQRCRHSHGSSELQCLISLHEGQVRSFLGVFTALE